MRSIEDEETILAPVCRVFEALVTPTDICQWWQATTAIIFAETGGLWVARWGHENDPDYLSAATLSVYDPPHRLVMSDFRYQAKSGPLPFDAKMETEFRLEDQGEQTLLRVRQTGFPDDTAADPFLQGCVTGWRTTLTGLSSYLSAKAD